MKLTSRVGGRQPWQSDSDKKAARTTFLQRNHVESEGNSADDPIADWVTLLSVNCVTLKQVERSEILILSGLF